VGARRDWATFGPVPDSDDLMQVIPQLSVGPDGLIPDSDGAVWVADALGNRVLRVAEGGSILQEVSTGTLGAFSCTLGGPEGRTLFICAAPDFNQVARAEKPEAQLLALEVDVPV
jgi:sugar lactone lactonase YvrE